MLKSIGSLHNIPAPSSAVLGGLFKLLDTFGDKKSIGTLLEQMREVQAHNEQVFREAQDAIGGLAVMRKELEDSRKEFSIAKVYEDLNIKRRLDELSQAEARLSSKMAKDADEQEAGLSWLDDKRKDLATREQVISSLEAKCAEKERDLGVRLSVLENKESAMRAKEQLLQSKEKKLRAALDE